MKLRIHTSSAPVDACQRCQHLKTNEKLAFRQNEERGNLYVCLVHFASGGIAFDFGSNRGLWDFVWKQLIVIGLCSGYHRFFEVGNCIDGGFFPDRTSCRATGECRFVASVTLNQSSRMAVDCLDFVAKIIDECVRASALLNDNRNGANCTASLQCFVVSS